jgi:hypothetical protein
MAPSGASIVEFDLMANLLQCVEEETIKTRGLLPPHDDSP